MSVEGLPPQMAQCSITGKMVPEDELVTIQGQRVCAEGKAILLERLKAGEAAPGELEKPTVLRRFGCIFLDGLIIGVPTAIASGIVMAATRSTSAIGAVSVVATLLEIVYFGQMHASRGQTVGKMAGKTMVVNLDGSPINAGTAYLRAVAYYGWNVLSGIALMVESPPFQTLATVIVAIWGLTDIVLALADTRYQRSLHDRIAGTRVVVKE